MKNIVKQAFRWLCIATAVIYLYFSLTGVRPLQVQRGIILTAFLALAPLNLASKREKFGFVGWLCIVLSLLGLGTGVYFVLNYEAIQLKIFGVSIVDLVFGIILIILLIDNCRRSMGWAMPILCIIFILYALFGQYLPGVFKHSPITFKKLATTLGMSSEGLWGSTLSAASGIIIIFIIFGCFMDVYGAGDFFTKLGLKFFGKVRGGPAKVSVITSALFGTVSGSPVANVMVTGSFTIPMMKEYGYDSDFAGGVEAAASTGGQIMPPIMGAGAFVMAEILGISYWKIVQAAIIPAILYFLAIYLTVDFEAGKKEMNGTVNIERITGLDILRSGWHVIIALLFLLIGMGAFGLSPFRTAGLATVLITILYLIKMKGRISWKKIPDALENSVKSSLGVIGACAAAGIIIGVINVTGIGVRMSDLLIKLSNGSIWILMLLTMLASIVLGMGVPTVAAYILLATLVTPALKSMGIPALAAHMFVFYFGVLAPVTPPVAMGAYAAASISGGNPLKTGVKGCQLAIVAFIVPFMFARSPEMLMEGTALNILRVFATSVIGVFSLTAALEGYLIKFKVNPIGRIILLASAILLIDANLVTDLIGIGLCVVGILVGRIRMSKRTA